MAFERFDVNGPIPPGANDLSQSFRIVLIRLVDLHLEGGACVPSIETNDFEPEIAEFMHQPWRHRSGLDPYAGVIPRMPADQNADLPPSGAREAVPPLFEFRNIALDPAHDLRMRNPAFGHHFDEVSKAEFEPEVPAHSFEKIIYARACRSASSFG